MCEKAKEFGKRISLLHVSTISLGMLALFFASIEFYAKFLTLQEVQDFSLGCIYFVKQFKTFVLLMRKLFLSEVR